MNVECPKLCEVPVEAQRHEKSSMLIGHLLVFVLVVDDPS